MPIERILAAGFLLSLVSILPAQVGNTLSVDPGIFVRGDSNLDQEVTIADASYLARSLFLGDMNLSCPDSSDLNDDGGVDIADLTLLVETLYSDVSICEPYPTPGIDPTADELPPCAPDPIEVVRSNGQGADIDHIYLLASAGTGDGVVAGQGAVVVPVLLDSIGPVRGFRLEIGFDPTQVLEPELEIADIEPAPEFTASQTAENRCQLIVIFDVLPPFDDTFLAAGTEIHLADLRFESSDSLSNAIGLTFVSKTELVGEFSEKVETVLLSSAFLPVLTGVELYVRGDTTGDGQVDVADCVGLLHYLQGLSPGADCLDSYDVDDSGTITLVDAINLLTYVFSGAEAPASPFPIAGVDSTLDFLSCP